VLLLVLFVSLLQAAEPKRETLQAWDEYIRIVNLHIAKSAAGTGQFLWTDESQDMARRVQRNEVVVTNRNPEDVPQGLIHDWVGAVFVPNVTLDRALSVVESYDRYDEFYKPLFSKCKVLARDGDQVQVVRLSPTKAYITSNAVRVQEIANYGQPTEHVFPENRRPGYVWREVTVQRLEARDGGVYVEWEMIVLSRGIPTAFRWLIKPLTDELPRKMMLDLLDETRTAVKQESRLFQSQELASRASR
jgi:hypothetical protein